MAFDQEPRSDPYDGPPSNPLVTVLRVLRRRWPWLLAIALLGLLVGGALAFTTSKSYTATATGWVISDPSREIALAVSADNLAKSRAAQYKELASTTLVAEDAVRRSGLSVDPHTALEEVTAVVPRDTSMVRLTATAGDPQEAARLADAWLDALKHETNRLTGADNATGATAVHFETVVPAEVPSSPSAPSVPTYMAGGLLLGFVLGVVLIALLEILDTRVRTADDLEAVVGVPPIGQVPKSRALSLGHRTAPSGDASSDSAFHLREAFNGLRTNLQFMTPDNPPRAITVTSLGPGDGKSTTAANLAVTLSEAGKQVILIDADMRRPTVAGSFGLVGAVGLSDVIVGRVGIQDALQVAPGHPDLLVLTAGQLPPNPSELLASERFKTLVCELAERFMVIIDSPPLLSVTDASITAARFDGALVVVDAETARRPEIRQAAQMLDRVHATVLGHVMNRVPAPRGSNAYAYAYRTPEGTASR